MPREFEWIDKLAARFGTTGPGLLHGIGSDCAVLKPPKGKPLVTTDMLVEGVHFDFRYLSRRDAGYRAVTTGLSDLAAGGCNSAWPISAFLSIAIPEKTKSKDLDELTSGFAEAFEEFGVTFAGGDTVWTPGPLVLNFAFIGSADKPITRSGARAGDRLYVAGWIGAAAAGLVLLQKRKATREDWLLLSAYRRPKPLLAFGARLTKIGATACADVSDGLLADARHIAEQSRLAVSVDLQKLPVHPHLKNHRVFTEKERLRLAAAGGDDYALVFTAPRMDRTTTDKLSAAFECPITEIGKCRKGPAGRILDIRGNDIPFGRLGYEHGRGRR